jgi:hypothetical protein
VGLFGRRPPAPLVPRPAGVAAQKAQVRAADERHYREHGLERVGRTAAYRREHVPGAVWLVVLDELTDRDPVSRSYVAVGLHDEALVRAVARVVPGGRYSAAVPSVLQALPRPEDTSADRLALRAVLLYGPGDGAALERDRVARVVAEAQRSYGGLTSLAQVRAHVAAAADAQSPGGLEDRVRAALASTGADRERALARLGREHPDLLPAVRAELARLDAS